MGKKTSGIDFESMISEKSILSTTMVREGERSSTLRTTFRLTEKALDALKILSNSLKIKSVFDIISEFLTKQEQLVILIAENAKKIGVNELKNCKRKSVAISQRSANIFNSLAKRNKVSRDSFINQSLIEYQKLLKLKKEQDVKKVRQAKRMIDDFWQKMDDFENKLIELLGHDHPVRLGFGYVPVMLENLQMAIDEYLETGKPIDPYSF